MVFANSSRSISGFSKVNKGGFYTRPVAINQVAGGSISQGSSATLTTVVSNERINELMRYDKMRNNIIEAFSVYMIQFKNGEFDDLSESFSEEEALRLGQILASDSLSTFSARDRQLFINSGNRFSAYNHPVLNFPTYKTFMHTIIDGLNSAVQLQQQNDQLRDINAGLAEYYDILTNIEKLKQYIDTNYHNFEIALFSASRTVNTSFILKPEIKLYFERYGIPSTGNFESEKMNVILREINIETQ